MNIDTEVCFEVYVAMNNGVPNREVRKEVFTLRELGYNPHRDSNLSEFLDRKWDKWKMQYINGGYGVNFQ